MGSKGIIFLCISLAFIAIFASEIHARELADTKTSTPEVQNYGGYGHGGHGGYGGGGYGHGHGGHGGKKHCHHGCSDESEAVEAAKP